MTDMPVDPMSEDKKKGPTARITVHKDHASKMKVGDEMKMHVKGKVKGVQESFSHPDHYDVDMEDAEVEPQDDSKSEKSEKYTMATMPRKDLKKKIMKSDDEEGA